jgi:hypothetical protein
MMRHSEYRRAFSVMLRGSALALLTCMTWLSTSRAGGFPTSSFASPLISVDWQGPLSLPPRFRNHCTIDPFRGAYCSDHCGRDYQIYVCSRGSFGCCRPGHGYCGWDGVLRCAP